jgi:Fe-S oxidoreductase
MLHEEILHRCFRCGYCKMPSNYTDLNCPPYLAFRFETYSPGGRMWLLKAWLDGKIEPGKRFAEIMFSCTACGNCTEHCPFPNFKNLLLEAFTAGREAFLDRGIAPAGVKDYLNGMQLHGNPYGFPAKKRADWAAGTDVEPYTDQEYLLFAGDVASYDTRGQEIARSAAKLLAKAGVSFGILKTGENSDGNDVRASGETALFEELAGKNIDLFNRNGVKKILTLSPHSFNAFKRHYPALGGNYQVFHYTQALAFRMGGLKFRKNPDPLTVTYHDPCYLGRHNLDYYSPRMILSAAPGLKIAEMDRNKQNSLCCGGGGGNFFTDILPSGKENPARFRVREAKKTGAEIIAVSCPLCAIMLEDAAKSEEMDGLLRVMEVSELINDRIP